MSLVLRPPSLHRSKCAQQIASNYFSRFKASWQEVAGVLVFSAIPFTAVKAIANSPIGESLQRRMEEKKKIYKDNSSKLKLLSDKAIIESESGDEEDLKGTHMREQQLTEMIEQKVSEAEQVCGEDEVSDECKVAWDEVEEVSQAKADLRLKLHQLHQDLLESFVRTIQKPMSVVFTRIDRIFIVN